MTEDTSSSSKNSVKRAKQISDGSEDRGPRAPALGTIRDYQRRAHDAEATEGP
jgi:hypothetical protein